jgi:hypothetical protein
MAITKEINVVVKEQGIDKINQQIDNLSKSLSKAEKEVTNLDASFAEVYGDLQPLTTRMGEAEDRLYELGLAGKQTSKEYQDLLKQVGNYRKVQIQTDLAVDAAASNLSQNLAGALSAVTGGFSVAQGALGAFGTESEDVNEAILKVQSAMAISSGFETIKQGTKSFGALKASIMANSVVTKIATTVQKLWNLAMAANPIGALVAVVLLAIGAIASLTSYLISSSKANKEAMNATEANSKALKRQSIESQKSSDALKSNNDYQYESAKAAGASSEQLRKLTIKHNEETIALNLKNAKLAQATFLRERDTLATLQANDASDEAIKKQKELTDSTYKEFQEQNKILSDSYKERHNIEKKNSIEVIGEKKSAQDKINEDAKTAKQKEQDRLKEEKQKDKEDLKKSLEEQKNNEITNFNEITKAIGDAQDAKSEMFITKQLAEEQVVKDKYFRLLELAKQQGQDTLDLEDAQANEINDIRLKYQDIDYANKKAQKDKELADEKLVADAKVDIANQTLNLISEIAGKGSKIGKAIAITQATISGVQGVQNAFTTANASPVTAVFPAYPFIQAGLAGAFSAIQIAKIAKGEKAGGGSTGGGGSSTPAAPSFNLVQGTASNQIASSIGKQQPIQAFVVSKDVTSSQELDRNIVKGASL